MIFEPIASSSAGNAYLSTDGKSRILMECGVPYKRLQKALNYAVQDVDACFITHEHKDHAGHVGQLLKRGVPVYATAGTIHALGADEIHPLLMFPGVSMGAPLQIATLTVVPFRVYHDAAEPVGYLIRGFDGSRMVFATDTVGMAYRFPACEIYAVEANYCEEILSRNTRAPESVICRIRNTHMDIRRTCDFLKLQDLSKCKEVWLLHLSSASSDEVGFVKSVRQVVPKTTNVLIAPK